MAETNNKEYHFSECIRADLERIEVTSFRQFLKWWFFPKGETIRWLVWFRIVQYAKRRKIAKYTVGFLAYLILRHYEYKYGIFVNSNIHVGKGLRIVHGGSVFINCSSVGDGFTAYPCTMLGAGKNGIPLVEDHVTVYTGGICVGDIRLGAGCVIGANSFVSKDVEPGHVMVGAEAHVLKKES